MVGGTAHHHFHAGAYVLAGGCIKLSAKRIECIVPDHGAHLGAGVADNIFFYEFHIAMTSGYTHITEFRGNPHTLQLRVLSDSVSYQLLELLQCQGIILRHPRQFRSIPRLLG